MGPVIGWVVAVVLVGAPFAIRAQDDEQNVGTITVEIVHSAFKYQARVLKADQEVTIVLHNLDSIRHGFTSPAFADTEVRVEADNVTTYGRGIKGLYLNPGEEVKVYLTPTHPGKLTFRCDLHPGMKGELLFLSVGAT
ncbi:MAG: cupredoxin domain-containing protein [Nitrospirae bacterium]|nr:cupredoxin domain-containing protein [Nitrospirota bacterium]